MVLNDFIFFLLFYTNYSWRRIDLASNNDNGNDIYNDDLINKMEWDFFSLVCLFIWFDQVELNDFWQTFIYSHSFTTSSPEYTHVFFVKLMQTN